VYSSSNCFDNGFQAFFCAFLLSYFLSLSFPHRTFFLTWMYFLLTLLTIMLHQTLAISIHIPWFFLNFILVLFIFQWLWEGICGKFTTKFNLFCETDINGITLSVSQGTGFSGKCIVFFTTQKHAFLHLPIILVILTIYQSQNLSMNILFHEDNIFLSWPIFISLDK
jgi:hypothetical protein